MLPFTGIVMGMHVPLFVLPPIFLKIMPVLISRLKVKTDNLRIKRRKNLACLMLNVEFCFEAYFEGSGWPYIAL